jgi:hypothetical protein
MPPEPVSADDPDEPWGDEQDREEEYDYAEVLADCDEAAEDRVHAAQAAARTGTTAALAAIAAGKFGARQLLAIAPQPVRQPGTSYARWRGIASPRLSCTDGRGSTAAHG